MTGARAKYTQHEREIAKRLGLTDAQLDALLRIKKGYWPGTAAACLEAKGLAYQEVIQRPHRLAKYLSKYAAMTEPHYTGNSGLTEAGEAKLAQARAMGF